jgi:hypothetical protein
MQNAQRVQKHAADLMRSNLGIAAAAATSGEILPARPALNGGDT